MSALTVFDVFVKIVIAILQHTKIIICIIIYLMFNLFVKMFSDDLIISFCLEVCQFSEVCQF